MEWTLKFICNREAEEQIAASRGFTKKLNKLLENLRYDPLRVPPAELLKHEFAGYRSRRIDKKNRLVYKVEGSTQTVLIFRMHGHYDDK